MSEAVIVGLIAGGASVLTGVLTYLSTKNKMGTDLDKKMDILAVKLESLNKDIAEHNHYAKLFAETMPVVQEQIKVINHRLSDLEKGA